MSTPAISVVMASYNGAAHIGATIESVLRQRLEDFEIVVADDCSTDETLKILAGFADRRLRVLTMPHNAGPVAARNLACEAARGRYLAALDQDDLAHPDRFAAQLHYLEANPGCAAVGTATCRLRGGRLLRAPGPARTTPDFMRWMLHTRNPLVWSSMMIRRSALAEAGSLNRDEFRFAEDYDLYHRLCAVGDVGRLDEILTIYRSHEAGASWRYRSNMMNSATAVLTRAYGSWFGAKAADDAKLMMRLVAAGDAVADLDDLHALTRILREVHDAFHAHHSVSEESRGLIAEEMAREWWRVARAGLRAGTLSIRAVWSERPDFAARTGTDATDLISSALVGSFRGKPRPDAPHRDAATNHTMFPHLLA